MKLVEFKFIELVAEYRQAIKIAVDLLNSKSEYDKGFQQDRTGYLDVMKSSKYAFHGFGCLVTTDSFTVDFDFGEGGRCDGIDPGFLSDFVSQNRKIKNRYQVFVNRKQVEDMLITLEKEGFFVKNLGPFIGKEPELYNDSLYYLISAINDPEVPIWKPYWPDEV